VAQGARSLEHVGGEGKHGHEAEGGQLAVHLLQHHHGLLVAWLAHSPLQGVQDQGAIGAGELKVHPAHSPGGLHSPLDHGLQEAEAWRRAQQFLRLVVTTGEVALRSGEEAPCRQYLSDFPRLMHMMLYGV